MDSGGGGGPGGGYLVRTLKTSFQYIFHNLCYQYTLERLIIKQIKIICLHVVFALFKILV